MAMPCRAARNTTQSIVHASSTPGTVGPGSYAPPRSLKTSSQPNFAAFASSNARGLSQDQESSTPGPGSYLAVRTVERKPVTNNAFKTSIARMAPSAPGSTCYVESSAARNPGPGMYRDPFKEPRMGPRPPQIVKKPSLAARVLTAIKSDAKRLNPPAIPRREQSHGYDETDEGYLTPLRGREDVIPGVGAETVGPAAYDIPGAIGKDGTEFAKSTTRRRVFEMKSVPGPGDYDPMTTVDAQRARQSKREGEGLACFKSRVPMAFEIDDARRPNTCDVDFLGPADNKPEWPSILQCFGSTSTRRGWHRRADLPYADPSSSATPGPGSYACDRSAFRIKLQRRLTDEPIAFNSSGPRPCLASYDDDDGEKNPADADPDGPQTVQPVSRISPPGPGAYDLKSESIVHAIQKRTAGRHGIFGSCSARFVHHSLPPEVQKMLQSHSTDANDTPGPGNYDVLRETTKSAASPRGQRHVFKSIVDRNDDKPQYDARAPQIQQVGSRNTPGVGDYTIPSAFSKPASRKGAPASTFTSKARRFDDNALANGDRIRQTPGPGTYQPERHHPQRRVNGPAQPMEQRFRGWIRTSTSPEVGPGAYVAPASSLAKTFNVSYTTEKKI
ncbi:hypothetical protein CTAYLR_004203 [Chrysophaeum taylorii]|uniref:Uncharacterized protein n=1 Tax=Chrysophaeum taylorii TaxID=2483200 RepID=A0AAD7UCM4_9STRA|nr:hypothetical protein CTAYLR_004203 [Chrysophaeum taylorii]